MSPSSAPVPQPTRHLPEAILSTSEAVLEQILGALPFASPLFWSAGLQMESDLAPDEAGLGGRQVEQRTSGTFLASTSPGLILSTSLGPTNISRGDP